MDLNRLALVAIDLQDGIVRMKTAPHSAETIVSNAARLAAVCRDKGVFVVLVHVGPSADAKDALSPPADQPRPVATYEGWDTIVPAIGPKPGDHVIRKRQWGAFYGTDLDLQLRRRHIETIMLCGIATNYGVESTARDAYERGYGQIIVEDACGARSAEDHAFSLRVALERIAKIRKTEELLDEIRQF